MKILGICCSPRKGQNTFRAMEICLEAARAQDGAITTQVIELADLDIRPCRACGECKGRLACPIEDDFASLIPVLSDSDVGGMIVGTPVYFGTMTAQCKAFVDRCVMFRRNGWLFRNRVGGVLAVGGVRNGGQELTLQCMHTFFLQQDMCAIADGPPFSHSGAAIVGKAEEDAVGLQTVRNLVARMVKTLKDRRSE